MVIIWFHVALHDIIDLNMIYMYVSECMKWHTYPHISYLSVMSYLSVSSYHQYLQLWYSHQDGDTALHRAANDGKVEIVKVLAENGATVDMQDKVSVRLCVLVYEWSYEIFNCLVPILILWLWWYMYHSIHADLIIAYLLDHTLLYITFHCMLDKSTESVCV